MRMPGILMLLLPLCSYVNAEIVKIKFLGHSFTPNEREKRDVTSSMPEKMAFHLETENGDTILNLERATTIPMYAFTGNGLDKMDISSRDVAVYKDELRKSVIKIRRQQENLHKFHLEGEIEIDDNIHQLSPFNSLENGDDIDVYHVLEEKEEEIQGTDYLKDFRRIIKHKVSKEDSNNPRPKRSLEEHVYTLELCYIADHQDYQKFLSLNNNDVDNTSLDINIYYSFVTEQIRLRYESIYEQDPSIVINIVISGLILLKDKISSKFMDDEVYDTNQLDYNLGLDVAVEWLHINEEKLPPSDHYMFFTAYDLSDAGQSDSLGLANLGCMCYRDDDGYYLSASIIENAFDGNVGATAAHELGHSLDADHDSDVGCDDNDLYLMSARSIHPWNVSYASRPWKLSSCSVQSIGKFLRNDNISCLFNTQFKDDVVTTSGNIEGQYYTIEEQCKMVFGDNSTLCPAKYDGDNYDETFCYILYCTSGNDCEHIFPRDYTTCADNKWCYKGLCVAKNVTRLKLYNIPSIINILNTTDIVIPALQVIDIHRNTVVTYHHAWKPLYASQYFNFDETSGKISVVKDVQFNISRVDIFITATDGHTTTKPQSFPIYIHHESKTPQFLEKQFQVLVDQATTDPVIISELRKFLVIKDQMEGISFRFLPGKYTNQFTINNETGEIRFNKGAKVRVDEDIVLTVEVSYHNFLKDTANFKLRFTKDTPEDWNVLNQVWFIPIISMSIIIILSLLAFIYLRCEKRKYIREIPVNKHSARDIQAAV